MYGSGCRFYATVHVMQLTVFILIYMWLLHNNYYESSSENIYLQTEIGDS